MSDNTKPEVSETAPKKSSQGVSQHFFKKKIQVSHHILLTLKKIISFLGKREVTSKHYRFLS